VKTIDDLTAADFERIQPGEQLISEDVAPASLRALAASVISQAWRELVNKGTDLEQQAEAFLFVTGPSLEIWADWAGMEYPDPYMVLPRLGEVKKTLRRRYA
jgi:hypothetical protein